MTAPRTALACVLVALAAAAVGRAASGEAADTASRSPTAGPPGLSDGGAPSRVAPGDPTALVSALGCGACHTGVAAPAEARRASPDLGSDGRPWRPDSLLVYLLSPPGSPRAGTAARMPAFHLSEPEALALTLFLETTLPDAPSGGSDRVDRLREAHPAASAARGRKLFLALDCAGCHAGTDVPAWKSAPELSGEGTRARRGWLTSWLAHPVAVRPFGFYPGTGTRMPDFRLTGPEVTALVSWLSGSGADATASPGSPSAYPAPPAAQALSPFRASEARHLLAARSACLGCHAVSGSGGRIGPDLTDVRLRRPDAYVWAMLRDPRGTRPRTVMPRSPESGSRDTLFYRLLVSDRLGASRSGAAAASGPPGPGAPDARNGTRDGYPDLVSNPLLSPDPWMLGGDAAPRTPAARYRHLCASCHGADGGGGGFNASHLPVPPARHDDSAAMSVRTDARLFDAVHGGGRVLGRSPRMPAFGSSETRADLWGLVGRIRELCGCRGPAWYRDNGESGVPSGPGGRR